MNQIRILFFATLRNHAGVKEVNFELQPGLTVMGLKLLLKECFPQIATALNTCLVAVNREFAFDDDVIPNAAEVAFFPPVSGGAVSYPTILVMTDDEIDVMKAINDVTLPTTGAVCIFTGIVRGITKKKKAYSTKSLLYESYQSMAEIKLKQVADEIRTRWPAIEGIAIIQRLGLLEPGKPTTIIACSAAHRDSGVFEATRYGIDRLKEIVPIWKKEISPEAEMWVEGHYIPIRGDD